MSAPRCPVPLVLEEARRVPDGMGGHVRHWHALGTVHAGMTAGAARAAPAGIGPQSRVVWRIRLRAARPGDPRRPVPGQRFRMETRSFAIDAVAEADAAGLWLDCHAREETQV